MSEIKDLGFTVVESKEDSKDTIKKYVYSIYSGFETRIKQVTELFRLMNEHTEETITDAYSDDLYDMLISRGMYEYIIQFLNEMEVSEEGFMHEIGTYLTGETSLKNIFTRKYRTGEGEIDMQIIILITLKIMYNFNLDDAFDSLC